MKEEGRTEDWGMNLKEPQKRPRRSILRAQCQDLGILQNRSLWHNVDKDEGTGLGKKNPGIQNTATEDSKGNIIVYNRQIQNIWENYATGL